MSAIIIFKQVNNPLPSIVGIVVSVHTDSLIIRNAHGNTITVRTNPQALQNILPEDLQEDVFVRITGKPSGGRTFDAVRVQILHNKLAL